MQYIAEHFGPALVAMSIFIVLAGLIVALLANDGTIASQFTNSIVSFFNDMRAVTNVGA